MHSDWILDVLADLRTYALSRDLPLLAEHLDDTALIALAEIAAIQERNSGEAHGQITHSRSHIRNVGASELA